MSILNALIGPVTGLLDKFIPDADTKVKLAHEIATMAESQHHTEVLAQLEVNKQEAAHKNLFVAGWRPFIGWTCGLALFNNYLIMAYVDANPMDISTMMPVLLGMLGLGGLRSYEKVSGVARSK